MIITLSGALGSGKSTVGKLLAQRLNMTYLSAGAMMRDLAAQKGLTIVQWNALCCQDPTADKQLDAYIHNLGETKDKLVLDSRLAFHFVTRSYKVKLKVDIDVAAKRIFADTTRQSERSYTSVDDVKAEMIKRRTLEVQRFRDIYNLDMENDALFDYVLDTTTLTPEQSAEQIIAHMPAA